MKPRKLALIVSILALGAIAAVQGFLGGRDAVKTIAYSGSIDSIEITRAGGETVSLIKEGDGWVIGAQKYRVAKQTSDAMTKNLAEIRVLGAVSGGQDLERYGLAEGERVTVVAKSSGKAVRTVIVGKNATTARQSYALIDDGKSVSMVSGSLKDVFDKGLSDLRDRSIWAVPPEAITRIEVETRGVLGADKYAIAKAGDPPVWTLVPGFSVAKANPDAELAAAWVQGLGELKADSFAPDGTLESTDRSSPLGVARLTAAGKVMTLEILSKGDDGKYLCAATESPYAFYLAQATVSKFFKPYSGMIK